MVALVWIYSFTLIIPIVFLVRVIKQFSQMSYKLNTFQNFGSFGYNCRSGKCGYLTLDSPFDYHQLVYALAFSAPCIAILVCYPIIHCFTKNSTQYIKKARYNSFQEEEIRHCSLENIFLPVNSRAASNPTCTRGTCV